MPINFPNSPSIGATYDYEGIHYIYNGVGWVNKSIFGISAGTNISFTNYNGTGPLIISATDTTGITSAVTSFNGYTGGVTGWAYYNDGINSGLDTDLIQGISGQRFVENLQTGLLYGGLVQVNAGNSAYFDVSAGVGIISTAGASLTAYPTPSLTYVTWNAFTGVTVTGIASDEETWISINSAGNVVQQNTKWLDSQFDNSIPLGVLIHPNNTTINFAVAIPHVAYGQPSQLDPFVRAFGPIKISGHEISANGANLQVNKSTGAAYLIGRNYATNPSSPNVVEDTNATPISTIYRYYRDGSGKFTVVTNSSIDPTKYDDGTGTLNTVPGGQYTIQRLFFLPGVPTVLASYYGRELYNSIETAQANIPFEQFNEDDSTASLGVFGGYLIVKSGATQLNNTADAKFINSGIFRNLSNIGGGGVAATSLDDLNDVTITSAANGQVLKYSSGVWVNESVSNLNLVSAAVAGSGISVSGATGSVTVTNTGVLSFNGNTGAIQGVSSINGSTGAITNVAFTNAAQTFSALQSFSSGISASGGTFTNNISVKNITIGKNTNLNTIIVGDSGLSSTAHSNSVIIGVGALASAGTNTQDVIAIGQGALNSNDGPNNFGIGVGAGYQVTIGQDNFFIGNLSGYAAVEGEANTALGNSTLSDINNGIDNTAIGAAALNAALDTTSNTAIGSNSMLVTSSGVENTSVGAYSLLSNTSGSGNVALGYNAGRYRGTASLSRTTGTGGIYIGYQARASANAMTDEIVIGRNAVGLGSNTAVIGATAQSSATIYGVMNLPGGLSASGGITFNSNVYAPNIVTSINGSTGAITDVAKTNTSQTFTQLQSFSSGISAFGGITFNSNIQINNKAILGSAALGAATPGCIEFDGNVVYAGTTGGRGVVSTQQISVMTAATKSLLSATGDQNIFDTPQDVITLAANTTYQIEGYILLSTGTTTTRNLSLRFTQGIVANAPTIHFATIGVPTTGGGAVRAQDTAFFNTTSGGVITQSTFATNSYNVFIRGLIKTVDSVTITPQIAFSAAPGGTNTVNFGTYISFIPIGNGSMASVGPWA